MYVKFFRILKEKKIKLHVRIKIFGVLQAKRDANFIVRH